MERNIYIVQGDEYRAKNEREFNEDAFFKDVYLREHKIVSEIVLETRRYKEQCHANKGYKIKYQGFGNNVIVFTAERGQGKTSAMQSFSEFLRNSEKDNGVLKGIKDVKFEVLDPIEPSALDSKENIIRVLISRLFFNMSKYEDSRERTLNYDEHHFKEDKRQLLKLFQSSYDNIDFLKGASTKDEFSDDLESLAKLGNSAKMKENLHDLIEYYLRIKTENATGDKYLVVQIDDADLATGDVFEICEDIHNYLSIPNVIVMVAFNDRQLGYTIYQKYLEQYESIFKLQKKLDISEKCYDMAMKYLEKIFPNGRRIVLPQIDEKIVDEVEPIYIKYIDMEGKIICEGVLQKLLLEMLYSKTGIVFVKRENERHPILPRSLRELTQLMKLLGEMESVECEKLIEEHFFFYREGSRTQCEKNKNNVRALKEYFMKDWCALHLDVAQMELLIQIDALDKKHKLGGTMELLSKYLAEDEQLELKNTEEPIAEIIYCDLIKYIKNEPKIRKNKMFKESILFLFTLFLHDWLNSAWSSEEEMRELMDFVGTVNYISNDITHYIEQPIVEDLERQKHKYQLLDFDIDMESLKKYLEKVEDASLPLVNDYLNLFCRVWNKGNKTIYMSQLLYNERLGWSNKINGIRFEVLRPIMTLLVNKKWLKTSEEQQRQIVEETVECADSVEEVQTLQLKDSTMEVKNAKYLIYARNVVFNYDVQQYIQNSLWETFEEERGMLSWNEICKAVYENIDKLMHRLNSTLAVDLKDICGVYLTYPLTTGVFLSNSLNSSLYIQEYKNNLKQEKEKIIQNIKEELQFWNTQKTTELDEGKAGVPRLMRVQSFGADEVMHIQACNPYIVKGAIKDFDIKYDTVVKAAEKMENIYTELKDKYNSLLTENTINIEKIINVLQSYETKFGQINLNVLSKKKGTK